MTSGIRSPAPRLYLVYRMRQIARSGCPWLKWCEYSRSLLRTKIARACGSRTTSLRLNAFLSRRLTIHVNSTTRLTFEGPMIVDQDGFNGGLLGPTEGLMGLRAVAFAVYKGYDILGCFVS